MNLLTKKLWSHSSIKDGKRHYVREIRKSTPVKVPSYRSLVNKVAEIAFNNPELALFYRGQQREYESTKFGTSIYPSIYRQKSESRKSREVLEERYEILNKANDLLIKEFEKERLGGVAVLRKFQEVSWAILQHYEICDTPLLDITHSLRVACSFALKDANASGIVYVLGMPHTNGSISYYADEQQINLRLLSICPPIAMRPHFQEGYLTGTFPPHQPGPRKSQYDVARKLVAKFRIKKNTFWDDNFHEIPHEALFPVKDQMELYANNVHDELKIWSSNKGFPSVKGADST